MANPIKGENNILYIYDTDAYKPVACLTSNNLASTVSILESQTKCDPGVTTKTPGAFSYSVGFEGQFIDTTTVGGDTTKASWDFLFDLQQALSLVEWKIDTDVTNVDSSKYYGSGYITDLDNTAAAGDELTTFTGTIDGTGAVSKTNPHPSI